MQYIISLYTCNNLAKHAQLQSFYLFIYSFGLASQLAGSQFPDQGLNPGHSSESLES